MKAIILARVSSKDQEEGLSIPSQVRRLTEYTFKKNLQVERTFQVTESSSKDIRNQFDEILTYIEKSKEPIALVTDTVDRLQRSFRETPLLDEMRKAGKLELHFLREGLIINKSANSSQLMQWDIGVLFASSYVRQLGDNVKRSKDQSIKEGKWTFQAPFGYKNVTLPSGKKIIEVDACAAQLVTKMFELYATGTYSFRTLAEEMLKLGLKSAKGKLILSSRVEYTLKNPFYYGFMRTRGELHPHQYPPIVSEWLFSQVQGVMTGHNKAPVQYAGKPLLLRGLITCGLCGCTVTGDMKKQKYVYYSCNNAKGICKKIWIREEVLLKVLMKSFDKMRLSDEDIARVVTYLKQACSTEQEFFKSSQEALHKELNSIQNRLSKLIDMHLDGGIDSETYHLKLEEYKARQRAIAAEVSDHITADESCLITAKRVLDLAKQAKEIFMSSNVDEKRQFLKFVHSNLTLNGEKLHLELREPFSTFVKMGDQTEWLPVVGYLRTHLLEGFQVFAAQGVLSA